jgi:hypothetical protein
VLERYPVLQRAVANQYQAILAAAATALSVATLSPLPLLLLLGGEFVVMPFMFERLKRRLEIEKKYAARQVETLSQAQRYEQLLPESKARFDALQRVSRRIRGNYQGLSAASQGILAEYNDKFEAILATCLRRLWLVQKYDAMIQDFDSDHVKAEIAKLEASLAERDVAPRVKEAWQQNLAIKQKLLEAVERNVANRTALSAELDSLDSLFELLLQKSLAATDARAFSAEMDDILSQAELDAASVQEMEQLLGAMPELATVPSVSDAVKRPLVSPTLSPPPPRPRAREGGKGKP